MAEAGGASAFAASSTASAAEMGPSPPNWVPGDGPPGLSAAGWERSSCAGQGDVTTGGERGDSFPKPPRWGKEQLWFLPDFLPR